MSSPFADWTEADWEDYMAHAVHRAEARLDDDVFERNEAHQST